MFKIFYHKQAGFDLWLRNGWAISWIPPWSSTRFGWDYTWNPIRIWLCKYGRITFYTWKEHHDIVDEQFYSYDEYGQELGIVTRKWCITHDADPEYEV